MSETGSRKRSGEPLEAPAMFAVYAVDAAGDEGIFGMMQANGEWMPFVTSRRTTALWLFEKARPLIEAANERARLIEFTRASVLAES